MSVEPIADSMKCHQMLSNDSQLSARNQEPREFLQDGSLQAWYFQEYLGILVLVSKTFVLQKPIQPFLMSLKA